MSAAKTPHFDDDKDDVFLPKPSTRKLILRLKFDYQTRMFTRASHFDGKKANRVCIL